MNLKKGIVDILGGELASGGMRLAKEIYSGQERGHGSVSKMLIEMEL